MRILTAAVLATTVILSTHAEESKTPMIDKYTSNLDEFYADCTKLAKEKYREAQEYLHHDAQIIASEEVSFIFVHSACMQNTLKQHTDMFIKFMSDNYKAI